MDDARQAPESDPTTPPRGLGGLLRRAAAPSLAVATVLSGSLLAAQPASADQLSSDRAQAAQIQATIEATGSKLSVLDQQYNAAQAHLEQVTAQISTTKANIAVDGALLHELRMPLGYWEAKDADDDLDAEVSDGAGELGFFSPHSWWPLPLAFMWRANSMLASTTAV